MENNLEIEIIEIWLLVKLKWTSTYVEEFLQNSRYVDIKVPTELCVYYILY